MVVGAGAVGSWVAAAAQAGGAAVTAVARGENGRSMTEHALRVPLSRRSPVRLHRFEVVEDTAALTGRHVDIAVVAVKSFDTAAVARQLANLDPPPVAVLSVQNGVGNEAALSATGAPVLAGSLTTSVVRSQPGAIGVGRRGGLGLARVTTGDAPDTTESVPESLVAAFESGGIPVTVFSRAEPMKWSKLLLNHLGTASSAVVRWPPWRCLRHPGLFQLERLAWLEALDVMKQHGWAPVDLPGYPVPHIARLMRWLPPAATRPLLWRSVRGSGGPCVRPDGDRMAWGNRLGQEVHCRLRVLCWVLRERAVQR